MKKLVSLVLALVMTLTLVATAVAEDGNYTFLKMVLTSDEVLGAPTVTLDDQDNGAGTVLVAAWLTDGTFMLIGEKESLYWADKGWGVVLGSFGALCSAYDTINSYGSSSVMMFLYTGEGEDDVIAVTDAEDAAALASVINELVNSSN